MDENVWHLIKGRYPQTHSFISYRKEKEGGFVFNPHLYIEKWINGEYNPLLVDFDLIQKNKESDLTLKSD